MKGIIPVTKRAAGFASRLLGKKPTFLCAMGTTRTALIPGLSATTRGGDPERPLYVPALDSELLLTGRCLSKPGLFGPGGRVGPAVITRSALELASIPCTLVDGGMEIKPKVVCADVGARPGGDISTGRGVEDPEGIFEKAKVLGEGLGGDYLVVGECIPGGTTTAMAVLLALGIDARGRMSSSLKENPADIKARVVEKALERGGISPGGLRRDPFKALELYGDPVIAAIAGAAAGYRGPVLLAGGTQMAAVAAVLAALGEGLGSLGVGTTGWLAKDPSSDLPGMVEEVAPLPVLAADLDFSASGIPALRCYEEGFFKEGTGAGGSAIAAVLKSRGAITPGDILKRVEEYYRLLTGG